MDADQLERALQLACAVATCPSAQLLAAFRADDLAVTTKADGSPVTRADRETEAVMRAQLQASSEFGGLAILGEEGGLEGGATPYRWLLDPLDGTMSFIRGIPTFGTIVALEETATGQPLLGVIHLPCFRDTFMAGRGLGSWCNGRRVDVSAAADLRTALGLTPDAMQFLSITARQCPVIVGHTAQRSTGKAAHPITGQRAQPAARLRRSWASIGAKAPLGWGIA